VLICLTMGPWGRTAGCITLFSTTHAYCVYTPDPLFPAATCVQRTCPQ